MPPAARPILLLALLAALALSGCGGGAESTTSDEPFAPQASLRALGGTQRTAKPTFVLRVSTRPGDANIRSVAVDLPPVVLFDPNSLGGVCPESKLDSADCAGFRRVGTARAVSPAYAGALSGPVYPVSGPGSGPSGLPRLAYLLGGGGAEITLFGKVVSKAGRIQAGVEDVPDAPLESFELRIDGGKPGYLVLSRDICSGDPVADATFTSQDGQVHEQRVPLLAACD